MSSTAAPSGASSQPEGEKPVAMGLSAAWSRTLTWISLFSATIGFFSFFDELMPNLVRLSFALKALTGAYTLARDWLVERLQWLLSLISIRLPDVPEMYLDALTVVSLVLAALNFESIRRYGRSLFLDFGRDLVQYCVNCFGGSFHTRKTLFDSEGKGVMFSTLTGFWVLGLLTRGTLSALGLRLGTISIPNVPHQVIGFIQPAIESAIVGFTLLVAALFLSLATGGVRRPPKGPIAKVGRTVSMLIGLVPVIWGIVTRGTLNGRRSVALALALLAILIGANWAAHYVLDPFVASPPQWICAMVTANPDALPEPRCGA